MPEDTGRGIVGLPEGGIVDTGDDDEASGKISLLDMNIEMMSVLGFASILLHLQAKALASNSSGANDGAGGFHAMRMGFGAGGLVSSASGVLRGQGMSEIAGKGLTAAGQAIHQHGLIGGSLAALAHQFKYGAGGLRNRNG
ncbi:MAG TPA: hypothetical protein VF194_13530 [Ferrovibrio sp.]|uniref:hypothetical protein n=1 Tax=Ferrovibrio sp. TaxID=1917215 RepID=UPI002ED3DDD9